MTQPSELQLPESHLNILQVVSAIAWADGNLSEEEADLLIDQFKEDLPSDPNPLFYADDTSSLFASFVEIPPISEQLKERIDAELAFKEMLTDYKYNPLSLPELVSNLKTQEDRCLAVKLAYMVIKASGDKDHEDNLVSPGEKQVYRELIDLVNLDNDLVEEIELQAEQDLDQFKHPFPAFIANLKHFFHFD